MTTRCPPLRSRTLHLAFSVLGASIIGSQACSDGATQPNAIAAATTNGFALSAASNNVLPGGDAESQIVIARSGGFTGTVTLAIAGAPVGVTATISPSSTAGTSATLIVTTQPGVPPGRITLTITGTAAGRADQTTTATIVIMPTAAATGNVTVDFSTCSVAPIWFAIQDGTGPWSQILGSSNVYRFDITSSKGGYAWVTRVNGGLAVQLASRAELIAAPISPCGVPQSELKTISGTLAGLGVDDVVNIGMGGALDDAEGVPITTTSFTLVGVRGGNQDLIAYRSNPFGSGIDDRMIIRRDQNIPNGGSVGTIDFASAESFAPAAATLTITGGGNDQLRAFMMYGAGSDCVANLLSDWPARGPIVTMRGVPAARQRANDLHWAGAYATTGSYRSASESFHTLGNHVLALPPALPTPVVSLPPGGHKRVQLSLPLPSDDETSVWLWYREQHGVGNGVDLYASSAWIGGSAVSAAVPDLSGVTGWKSSFLPTPDAPIVWGLYASGANGAAAGGACAEGARFFTTSVTGRA